MSTQLPKVTVVTVVYNGQSVIENTLQSVLNQDYPHLEYIVVDGASTDSTLTIIKHYAEERVVVISEPDEGVYDAMNKGLARSTGDWILFMNAGDYFFSPTVISDVMSANIKHNNYSVIYGDAEFRLQNIAYISQAASEVTTDQYMPFSHQAAFTKTSVAKLVMFDLTYKIAADTAFFLQLVKQEHQMIHLPITICSYNALEGLSADNEVKRSKEIVALQAKWNGIDPNSPHFTQYVKDAQRKQLIRKLIPNFIWIKLRERAVTKKYQKVYTIV